MSDEEPRWYGNFFSLDRQQWSKALDLGMTPAVAYLMIAQGAQSSGTSSKWSARSIANRTGLGWKGARSAIAKLCIAGLLRQTSDDPQKPDYVITTPDERPPAPNVIPFSSQRTQPTRKLGREELVWLPCRIVEDVDDRTSVVETLRQTHSVHLLRLFVDLYYFTDLLEHGGVDPSLIHFEYYRLRLGERGPYTVWGFEHKAVRVPRDPLIAPFLTGEKRGLPVEGSPYQNDSGWAGFVHEIDRLRTFGLVSWVPQAYETADLDAVRMFAFGCYGGHPYEKRIAVEGRRSAMALLNARGRAKADKVGPVVFPLAHHRGAPVVKGVLRLTYLAHTTMTARWLDERYAWKAVAEEHAKTAEVYGRSDPVGR